MLTGIRELHYRFVPASELGTSWSVASCGKCGTPIGRGMSLSVQVFPFEHSVMKMIDYLSVDVSSSSSRVFGAALHACMHRTSTSSGATVMVGGKLFGDAFAGKEISEELDRLKLEPK
jgi:hypothetical protein